MRGLTPTDADLSPAPVWARDAVIYHIFPDRFAKGSELEEPAAQARWRVRPTRHGFMGGTLQGITDRLDYLVDLGVSVIYLTPIFLSSSNHRYNTFDYYTIDPRLGKLEDFQTLVAKAHANDIRVLLDGVFNHCGRGFYPFYDVLENGARSVYRKWFYIDRFPIRPFCRGRVNYRGWQGRPFMPILNLQNPETRRYFVDVANYWMGQGIDGWRVDAVGEVRGHAFWKELCRTVRRTNRETYLLAEVWGDAAPWLRNGQFDGATNYLFREIVLEFFVTRAIDVRAFSARLRKLVRHHPWDHTLVMANPLSSHDTERIATVARGDWERLKLALLFQFVYPGIPMIYYGDEVGLVGGRDPDNRRAMEWDPGKWNHELRDFIKRLIAIRKHCMPLRQGDWRELLIDTRQNLCLFLRQTVENHTLLLFNNQDQPVSTTINLGTAVLGKGAVAYVDLLSNRAYPYRRGCLTLTMPRRSGLLLVPSHEKPPGGCFSSPCRSDLVLSVG